MAIVDQRNEWELQEFLLDDSLRDDTFNKWKEQYKTFAERTEEIAFTLDYTLNDGQIFKRCPWRLPSWLEGRNSENTMNTDQFDITERGVRSIKGVVAFARNDEGDELMLFQNFNQGHIIQQGEGGWMKLFSTEDRRTYGSPEDSLVRFGNKLTAVYSSEDEKLLFDNLRNAKTFLPSLKEIYDDTSNEIIENILNHDLVECENREMILENTTQAIHKQFALLKELGHLDMFSAEYIQEQATEANNAQPTEDNIEIQVQNDKIVFPTDNDSIKAVLEFLCDGLVQGLLSGNRYKTTSKLLLSNIEHIR